MADTQTLTTSASLPADRRGDLLEIDTPPEQQPVFTLPVRWQPIATVADDTPAPSSRATGAMPTAPAAVEAVDATPSLPAFLRGPAPQVKAGGDDPAMMPAVALSSYSGGGGGGGGGSGGGSTGPLPGGYVVGMKVQEVDFRGDEITVFADPGRTKYPGGPPVEVGAARAPEWRDGNIDGVIVDGPDEWAVPVAYIRNTKPVVWAKFKVTELGNAPQGASKELTVRGLWRGYGVSMLCPEVVVPAEGDYVYYPATPTFSPLPDYVDSVRSADIEWQYRIQGDMNWYGAGTSSNEMFVTLAQPINFSYHTVISLSTRASWGAKSIEEVVACTWARFECTQLSAVTPAYRPPLPNPPLDPAPIRTAQPLHYYKAWRKGPFEEIASTTDGLLREGDGQCFAWVDLFRDTLTRHGAVPGMQRIKVTSAKGSDVEGFAVNSWELNAPGTSGNPIYPYRNQYVVGVDLRQKNAGGNWEYNFLANPPPEAIEKGGVGGQGPTPNPHSLFDNHRLLLIDGSYYDPSYGTKFSGLREWEDGSVAAYYDRSKQGQGIFDFRTNPTALNAPIDVVGTPVQ